MAAFGENIGNVHSCAGTARVSSANCVSYRSVASTRRQLIETRRLSSTYPLIAGVHSALRPNEETRIVGGAGFRPHVVQQVEKYAFGYMEAFTNLFSGFSSEEAT